MTLFVLFLLIFQLLNLSRGDPEIGIFKEVNGVEEAVSDKLEEAAGTNLTLICRVVDTYRPYYYWHSLTWGWKRGNVQFDGLQDLINMARDNSKLQQFSSSYDRAVKKFEPLFPQDSGTYFCMNSFEKLFKIIELSVHIQTDPDNLNNYLQVLNKSQSEFNFDPTKNYVTLPKFLCSNKLFMCNSGTLCVNYKYVCDGINDCKDNSDENIFLCGANPCKGRGRCHNTYSGRCCCEKDLNLTCVNPGTSCCFEEHHYVKYVAIFQSCFFVAYKFMGQLHPLTPMGASIGFSYSVKESLSEASVIVIIISCITIAIVIILGIIFRKRLLKTISKYRSGNPQDASTDPSSSVGVSVPSASTCIPNVMPNAESRLLPKCAADGASQLKPPSYDEVVANTQPSAPALEKCMA